MIYETPALILTPGSGGAREFGKLLKLHRKVRGLTQGEVATDVECSTALISMVEAGNRVTSKQLTKAIVNRVVDSLYFRFDLDANVYYDIKIMDPVTEIWNTFRFETSRRKTPSEVELEGIFKNLTASERSKVFGYIDALIETRGD